MIGWVLQWGSVILALVSASCWMRSATVKVSHEAEMTRRKREAEKRGAVPNFASAALDGWDLSATFASQSRWNAAGAVFAGAAVLAQAIAPLV